MEKQINDAKKAPPPHKPKSKSLTKVNLIKYTTGASSIKPTTSPMVHPLDFSEQVLWNQGGDKLQSPEMNEETYNSAIMIQNQ